MLARGETAPYVGITVAALVGVLVVLSGAASATHEKATDNPLVCLEVMNGSATVSADFRCDDGEVVDARAEVEATADVGNGQAGVDTKLDSTLVDLVVCVSTEPQVTVERSTSCDDPLFPQAVPTDHDGQVDPDDIPDLAPDDTGVLCVRLDLDEPSAHVDLACVESAGDELDD